MLLAFQDATMRDIQAPQLIVAGLQSNGKSSVLEAISGVHFGIDHKLCTRFPKELALRESEGENTFVSARIIQGKHIKRTAEQSTKLRAFKRKGCSLDDLPELIRVAKEYLGIRKSTDDSNLKAPDFTDDILRLEIEGPRQHPITLIDLPVCYYAPGDEQGESDINFVHNMVDGYMSNERSIILLVVSASSEPTTQSLTELARSRDKKQERTLGIITRPDTTQPGDERERIIRLAENKLMPLKKGWHTVRNLTTQERRSLEERKEYQIDDAEIKSRRDDEERRFLNSGEWARIPPADKGADALREKLSNMLVEQIRSILPELIPAVIRLKKNRTVELEKLGAIRKTSHDQRTFMVPMAQVFVRIANAAVAGHYDDEFFGNPGDRTVRIQDTKLRANITELSLLFGNVMMVCGRKVYAGKADNLGRPDIRVPESKDRQNPRSRSSSVPSVVAQDRQNEDAISDSHEVPKGTDDSETSDDDAQVGETNEVWADDEECTSDIFSYEYHSESQNELFHGIYS